MTGLERLDAVLAGVQVGLIIIGTLVLADRALLALGTRHGLAELTRMAWSALVWGDSPRSVATSDRTQRPGT